MTQGNKIEYSELSKAKISESRNIVISYCSKGGFTIAQQLEAKEDQKITTVFMKGAIHVEDEQGLFNLRDAINLAIQKSSEVNKNINNIDWD